MPQSSTPESSSLTTVFPAAEGYAQVFQTATQTRGLAVIKLFVHHSQVYPLVKVGRFPDLLSVTLILQTYTKVPVCSKWEVTSVIIHGK